MTNHGKSAEARHPSRKGKRLSELASVESPSKACARKIKAAMSLKAVKEISTLGLYSLKTKDSPFGVPYCAINDSLALSAAKQLLPQANLYRVGTFCLYDGKCTACAPVLVLDNKVN